MSNNYLFGKRNQLIGSPFSMNERSKLIGANVARLRGQRGWSQKVLADEIGVRQNTIAAIELGKTKKSKHLPDIANVFKVSMTDLDPMFEAKQIVRVPSSKYQVGSPDLELHNSVEAGDGAIVISNEPVAMIDRPQPLIGVRGAYGVMVVGESMNPVIRPGDSVMINPHLQPRREDICLFIYDENGDFRATLKEFISQTKSLWEVRRYCPELKDFTLSKRDWPKCHVVVSINKGR